MITAEELVELRQFLGISQERLGFCTGVSSYRIGMYERGVKPLTEEELFRIQSFLFEAAEALSKSALAKMKGEHDA